MGREKPAYILIDMNASALSTRKELKAYLVRLKTMPKLPEVRRNIIRIRKLLGRYEGK